MAPCMGSCRHRPGTDSGLIFEQEQLHVHPAAGAACVGVGGCLIWHVHGFDVRTDLCMTHAHPQEQVDARRSIYAVISVLICARNYGL